MHRDDKVTIGIGGTIASGKTTVSKIFEEFGAHYISADEIGWDILPEISEELKRRFGPQIMNGNTVDRKKLRNIVFADQEKLNCLNRLSHPFLVKRILEKIDDIKSGVVVLDAALLFDWPEVYTHVDYSVLVTADEATKEKHALKKGIKKDDFRRILNFQKSESEMAKHAGFIIRNCGTIHELRLQCQRIYKEIEDDC